MKKVLILCTGNSCRSIMAEAMINQFLGDKWQAYSAGTQPSVVNPHALHVLQELGIDTDSLYSKSVTEFLKIDDLDLVITVCDNAKEACPIFLKPVKQIHIGIEDPAPYTNEPDDIALPIFRQTRTEIMNSIIANLDELVNQDSVIL
ncbi:MAG: arsenate reductase ArsC [Candidatus Cloacimonas sp.]|jgi:arsenate reductase|nr:arsenate reductase ArsC [Candidatus Cloacimonas sp.]